MHNIQASNLMTMLIFVMVVVNIYSNRPRKAKALRSNVESQVKVTRKVIKCKKIKCHNFNSKTNGETLMRLQHPVAKIFPETLCISLVNKGKVLEVKWHSWYIGIIHSHYMNDLRVIDKLLYGFFSVIFSRCLSTNLTFLVQVPLASHV